MILILAILGGFITRLHGSSLGVPRWLTQAVWALPFGLAGCSEHYLIGLLAFGFAFGGLSLGHGRGQSLKDPLQGDPELVEVFSIGLIPYLPTYWYKCIVLSLWGYMTTNGGIVAAHNIEQVFLVALGGLLCPVGYTIGWGLENKLPKWIEPTNVGEFLTGFFGWGFLALAFL